MLALDDLAEQEKERVIAEKRQARELEAQSKHDNSKKQYNTATRKHVDRERFSQFRIVDRKQTQSDIDEFLGNCGEVYNLSSINSEILRRVQLSRDKKWAVVAIIGSVSKGRRKGEKSGEYLFWKITDLGRVVNKEGKRVVSPEYTLDVVIGGDAILGVSNLKVGRIVVIRNAKVQQSTKDSAQRLLSVTKKEQVVLVGTCPDFGQCGHIFSDGRICGRYIHRRRGNWCEQHTKDRYTSIVSNRMGLSSTPGTIVPLNNKRMAISIGTTSRDASSGKSSDDTSRKENRRDNSALSRTVKAPPVNLEKHVTTGPLSIRQAYDQHGATYVLNHFSAGAAQCFSSVHNIDLKLESVVEQKSKKQAKKPSKKDAVNKILKKNKDKTVKMVSQPPVPQTQADKLLLKKRKRLRNTALPAAAMKEVAAVKKPRQPEKEEGTEEDAYAVVVSVEQTDIPVKKVVKDVAKQEVVGGVYRPVLSEVNASTVLTEAEKKAKFTEELRIVQQRRELEKERARKKKVKRARTGAMGCMGTAPPGMLTKPLLTRASQTDHLVLPELVTAVQTALRQIQRAKVLAAGTNFEPTASRIEKELRNFSIKNVRKVKTKL